MPITTLHQQLLNALADLKSEMQRCRILDATVASIPPIASGKENDPINSISPVEHNGCSAVALAMSAFEDLRIIKGYSQKSARRYVGVLRLSADDPRAENVRHLVADINRIKIAIKDEVTQLPTRSERFRAVHDALPGIMTCHLYRTLHLVEEGVNRLGFFWQNKKSICVAKKPALLSKIENEFDLGGDWERRKWLVGLHQSIAQTPETKLRVVRSVKVQPAANALYDSGKVKTISAPLPFFLIQNAPIKITTIPVFNAEMAATRKQRSDQRQFVSLGKLGGWDIQRCD